MDPDIESIAPIETEDNPLSDYGFQELYFDYHFVISEPFAIGGSILKGDSALKI
jgi:hypothetical protein